MYKDCLKIYVVMVVSLITASRDATLRVSISLAEDYKFKHEKIWGFSINKKCAYQTSVACLSLYTWEMLVLKAFCQ